MAFPTAVDPADRTVGSLSPLLCQAKNGYGVSSAHHGEVRRCRRACERTPLRSYRRCAAVGRHELGLGWSGIVLQHADRWLRGLLTTLRRYSRVGGNGMLFTRSSGCGTRCMALGLQGDVSHQKVLCDTLF
jgi:hypothetical protein